MVTAQHTLLWQIHQLTAQPGARQWTDRELLEDFAERGSEAAFSALVARHGPMVLRAARRVLRHEQDAEDAFQATFLVLARNAASIRKREAVASWLHGAAYRTAMQAKRSAARRRNHEARLRAAARPAAPSPVWDEVQAALDEEIQRLPEPFRAAFVLCVLEGKGRPEVAAELGVKEGTVWSRLTRARRLLQRRLTQRGIKLSALLAALSLAESPGRAALPAGLARSVIRFGPLVAAGEPAAGAIPTHVAALAAGVTRAMFPRNVKLATAVLLAVGLVATGAGVLARQALAAEERSAEGPPSDAGAPKAPAAKPAADELGAISYSGRVLGPDGRPVGGAKLYLTLSWSYLKRPAPAALQATTGPDGRFQFTVPRARYGQSMTSVVATAPGCGPAWVEVRADEPKDKLELRLVKDDVPLTGRVVDLQGRPVRGATVRVLHLLAAPGEDLGPWAEAARAKTEGSHELERKHLPRKLMSQEIPGLPKAATTGADGRFRLTGLGRERMAVLQIEGPTIATRQVRALTRAGATVELPEWKPISEPGLTRPTVVAYYGATFTHAAAPTKPIVGVVRDRDTNMPLAGVTVESYKLANNPIHGVDHIRTQTDAQGRYRLTGMPKGQDNKIVVIPPDDQPYVPVHAVVPDTNGLDPVTVDFGLKRGVWVEGKVTDKAMGRPVQTSVQYFALLRNPNLRDHPGFDGTFLFKRDGRTKADGSYRVVGIPGPGLVVVQAGAGYLLSGERDDAEGAGNKPLYTSPYHLWGMSTNALAPIDPAQGADRVTRDVALDPGETLHGTLVGPDGKPRTGVRAYGLTGNGGWERDALETAEFTVRAFNPRRPRPVLFRQVEAGLVGVLVPPKDARKSVTVRLQPGATAAGRLVDADGRPRANVELDVSIRVRGNSWDGYSLPGKIKTDQEGRFRVGTLLPGYSFELYDRRGTFRFGDGLRSGETKDLGDVRLRGEDG
jgi:RNA polymerase sigma factor (sigma-70 family)